MKVRTQRPPKVRAPMDKTLRAKIFAPFEALGPLGEMFEENAEECRTEEPKHIKDPEGYDQVCTECTGREDI